MRKEHKKVISALLLLLSIVLFFGIKKEEVIAASESSAVTRVYGDNRFDTSALISQESFEQADRVFITNAREFADALAGVPLAYHYDAPILLAQGTKLSDVTVNEINRLKAKEAIILGGESAVTPEVEKTLKGMGLTTRRIAGDTRFKTAELIASELRGLTNAQNAVLVDGFEYADAMSVAPFAAREGLPIILSHSHKLTSKNALEDYSNVTIIGGETAISKEVEKQLKNSNRIAGKDRYETNMNVMEFFGLNAKELYVATGLDFPDALTGSLLAAQNNSAVALVKSGLNDQQAEFMSKHNIDKFVVFGGETVVKPEIETDLKYYDKASGTTAVYAHRERDSVVMHLHGHGMHKVIDPDGKTHLIKPDKDGTTHFIYNVDSDLFPHPDAGDEYLDVEVHYTFTIISKSGNEEVLNVTIPFSEYRVHTSLMWTGDIGGVNNAGEVELMIFGGNLHSITAPNGTKLSSKEENQMTGYKRHLYSVSKPGTYVFKLEHRLGETEEIVFDVEDYYFQN